MSEPKAHEHYCVVCEQEFVCGDAKCALPQVTVCDHCVESDEDW